MLGYIGVSFCFLVTGFIWGTSILRDKVDGVKEWLSVPLMWPGPTLHAFIIPGLLFVYLGIGLSAITWLSTLLISIACWRGGDSPVEACIGTVLTWPLAGEQFWIVGMIVGLFSTFLGITLGLAHKKKGNDSQSEREPKPLWFRITRWILAIALGALIGILLGSDLLSPLNLGLAVIASSIAGGLWGYFDAKRAYNSSRRALPWAAALFLAFPVCYFLYQEIKPKSEG